MKAIAYLLDCWLKVSGRSDDGQLTGDARPAQTDVIWMSDSTAEYAKYATIIYHIQRK